MNYTANLKKIIALEFLILLALFVLTGFVWLGLHLRNYNYDRKISSIESRNKTLNLMLYCLPEDNLLVIYGSVQENLIFHFRAEGNTYSIPAKDKIDFLTDFPSAKLLQGENLGYSYYQQEKSTFGNDTSNMNCAFDYVDFAKFKEFLNDSTYRRLFYNRFSKLLDLNNYSSFTNGISHDLEISRMTEIIRQNITQERDLNSNTVINLQNQIFSTTQLADTLSLIFIVILILVYPLRFVISTTVWAIKTIKNKDI